MESEPRGYMLIISNKVFEKMTPRVGSDKDLTALDTLFQKIGFEVDIKHNLKAKVNFNADNSGVTKFFVFASLDLIRISVAHL